MAEPSSRPHQIRALWDRLSPLPAGKWLYSRVLGRLAPYTGSIRPRVRELGPGYARVTMADRRAVRNHLNSIHAIALMNLAEVTTGLAMHYDLTSDIRAILVGLSIEYHKKARGELVAEARADIPRVSGPTELTVETVVKDGEGDTVATASARWLLDSRKPQTA